MRDLSTSAISDKHPWLLTILLEQDGLGWGQAVAFAISPWMQIVTSYKLMLQVLGNLSLILWTFMIRRAQYALRAKQRHEFGGGCLGVDVERREHYWFPSHASFVLG